MQQGSADRYFQEATTGNPNADKLVPEGIEGRVPYKGSVVAIVFQMAGGLRAVMGYCGCATHRRDARKAEFVEITTAGIRESHVHDVQITKEAPNYRAGVSSADPTRRRLASTAQARRRGICLKLHAGRAASRGGDALHPGRRC